jgi:hypothetical protein
MSKPKGLPSVTLILKISCPRPRTSNYTEPAATTVAALSPYSQYSYEISSSFFLSSQFIWTLFCLINIRHKTRNISNVIPTITSKFSSKYCLQNKYRIFSNLIRNILTVLEG